MEYYEVLRTSGLNPYPVNLMKVKELAVSTYAPYDRIYNVEFYEVLRTSGLNPYPVNWIKFKEFAVFSCVCDLPV